MRAMTTAAQDAFVKTNFPALIFVQLDFVSGTLYLCNAGYSFAWNGHNWIGLGNLGSIESIPEGSALQMYGCGLTLSGIPTEFISETLNPSDYQGKAATIWLAPLTNDYQIIADPVVIFKGRMDTCDILLGKTATITLTVESRLVDWERARIRRYNNADQQAAHPGDKGMQYVDQMVQRDLPWGRKPE